MGEALVKIIANFANGYMGDASGKGIANFVNGYIGEALVKGVVTNFVIGTWLRF